jgi:uncharacterized zinc-type alcohol dehydrogenase-like protein
MSQKYTFKNLELQKPKKVTIDGYKLNPNTNPINAIGYATDHKKNPLVLMEFDRRAPNPDDVVIQIAYCGVCHSDWHVILNEWKNTKYPTIVGHEITGIVIKIGPNVKKFKIGNKVAVGPNYNSCRQCSQCQKNNEQYCINEVTETYNMPDRKPYEVNPTGPITYGGYSNVIVVSERFVFRLPSAMPLDLAAPLLCAGVTMYTPLKEFGVSARSKVGIAGIGGLGHIGIKLAKAFGAEVVALTRTPAKKTDSIRLGANSSILMMDDNELKLAEGTFDLIINTIPFNHDLLPYLKLLKNDGGTLWIVGSFFTMATDFDILNRHGKIIRGSSTAGTERTRELLKFCDEKKIYPEIEIIDIKQINQTHPLIISSEVKYRFVIKMDTINK